MNKSIKYVLVGFTILPIIFLLVMIFCFHVDTPIWDSWRMIPLFEKSYGGGLTFGDFWQQHNEHRLIFSRIIILTFGRLTSWNTLYEVLLNVLITLGVFIVVYKQLKQNFPKLPWYYILPVFSLLLFSISQFESWMQGFTIHIFLHQLALVIVIWHLTQKNLTWKNLVLVTIFSVIATFSFGSALIIWPLVFSFLILRKDIKSHIKWRIILYWLIISGITIASYMTQFQANASQFWFTAVRNPTSVIMFTLLFIGRPLTIFLYLDTFWGIIVTLYALLLTVGMVVTVINRRYITFQQITPIIFYIIFTLGTAFVIALGRAEFGYEAARASRYITVANLFWLGIFSIWFMFYYFVKTQTQYSKYLRNSTRFLPVIFSVFILMLILSSIRSVHLFKLLSDRHQREKDNILNYTKGDKLEVYSYTEEFLKENIEILKKHKLSVFREK